MNRLLGLLLMAIVGLGVAAPARSADYPTPSPYPISWELTFTHSLPQRIVVQTAADQTPLAYWFITYKVTNNTRQERMFLPMFTLLTDKGVAIRANNDLPPGVFEAIKKQQNNRFLQEPNQSAGELRIGEDEALESVAIWAEPNPRMGRFSIFVTGLSGEAAPVLGADDQPLRNVDGTPVLLRKTLQLNYHIAGDEVYPGEDKVDVVPQRWVMR